MKIAMAAAGLLIVAAFIIMGGNVYFAYRGARYGHAPSGINGVPGILLVLAGMLLRLNGLMLLPIAFLLDFGSTLGASFFFGLIYGFRKEER